MPTLVLLRHGVTVYGEENRFAGWADTPLSAAGIAEAQHAAQILKHTGLVFDLCLTSRLARAQHTLAIIQATLGLPDSVIRCEWRLNERHYGGLQDETRAAMIERFGNAQVIDWRRSYDACPPLLDTDDARFRQQLARFPDVDPQHHPRGESLHDAIPRVSPVWPELIVPALKSGKCVLIVAHTSSLRALTRIIEGLNDTESAAFRIATAIPRRYEFNENLGVVDRTDLRNGKKSNWRYWIHRIKTWLHRIKKRWLTGFW